MLEVEDLTVAYGDVVAVRELTIAASDGEVLAIIGPSGCGKSTLLRAIAGLVRTASGTIRLDGHAIDDRRPDRRGVGLMFQDNALFPHRTVGENVAFGPRMHGMARDAIDHRTKEALELVDLAGTESRSVTELSGGEQQRVALARAIAPRPRLLMLDEPLGSLDRALRDRLLTDLPAVFAEIGTTVVYVTHDQEEALELADRIAVMDGGRILQVGTPASVWRAPRSEFVARFLGLDHVIDAEVVDGTASTIFGALPAPGVADGPATAVLLPDALRILDHDPPPRTGEHRLQGVVVARRFAGDHTRVRIATAAGPELEAPIWQGSVPAIGEEVCIGLDPRATHVLR